MLLCSTDCIPCCDFCVHVRQGTKEVDGKFITTGPIECLLHSDDEHQTIARGCGYCEDFYCFRADVELHEYDEEEV